jgi:hypothetical protein
MRAFAAFWWDFIVGDDPLTTLVVALGFAATAALSHDHVSSWWLLPAAVAAVTARSLARAVRAANAGRAPAGVATSSDGNE